MNQIMKQLTSNLHIQIHGVDGSLTQFTQDDPEFVQQIVQDVRRPDFFAQDRITIAGRHSVTTLITCRIARLDLAGGGLSISKPPSQFTDRLWDAIEMSEQEFLYQVEVRDLDHVERRDPPQTRNQTQFGFVDVQLVGGQHIYLKLQLPSVLPAERLRRVHSALKSPGLSFRLASGGIGIANLANAVKFTAYPGPPEVPANAWSANETHGATTRLEFAAR